MPPEYGDNPGDVLACEWCSEPLDEDGECPNEECEANLPEDYDPDGRRMPCNDLQLKIGCVTFTPHGWDVAQCSYRRDSGCMMLMDVLILELCRAGF